MHGTYIICVQIPASSRIEFDYKIINLAQLSINWFHLHFVNFILAKEDKGQPVGFFAHVCEHGCDCSCVLATTFKCNIQYAYVSGRSNTILIITFCIYTEI